MTSIIKVDNLQNQCGANIINENAGTITIGASGDTIALAAGATSSGFGATYNGAVNWDTTAKTTTVTAASGVGYFVDTTSGGVTVNLPAGTSGAVVALSDYAGTWDTNNVTVTPDGSEKIGGVAAAATLNTKGQAVTFVYVDSTRGWTNVGDATFIQGAAYVAATGGTITTCGDYKIHKFTGPGTFTVTNAGQPTGSTTVDYLVVAGGGGGGGGVPSDGGAGGGAGGFRLSNSTSMPAPLTSPLASPAGIPVSVQGYPITVGGGGGGGAGGRLRGTQGSSSIFNTITSAGGGGGGAGDGTCGQSTGGSGGSGGGGHQTTKGLGNTPPVNPAQGTDGADGPNGPPYSNSGAGGGGAGGVGSSAQPSPGCNGGAGGIGSYVISTGFAGPEGGTGPIPGAKYFSGGGGGGNSPTRSPAGTKGAGGAGGGADGSGCGQNTGRTGSANTGGGGGGGASGVSGNPNGGSGGSGIVLIRYKFQ
jgi:hypothetical protein